MDGLQFAEYVTRGQDVHPQSRLEHKCTQMDGLTDFPCML